MGDLSTITDMVKTILESDPKTRNCDGLLYIRFLDELSREKGETDYLQMTVLNFLHMQPMMGVPTIETVSRIRRKVQRNFPELKSSVKITNYRAEREEMFREYARR